MSRISSPSNPTGIERVADLTSDSPGERAEELKWRVIAYRCSNNRRTLFRGERCQRLLICLLSAQHLAVAMDVRQSCEA